MSKKNYIEYCGLPWNIAMIDSTGDYGPCCGKIIGKIKTINEVDNFWNSKEYKEVRNNLLNNKKEGICKDCIYLKVMINKPEINDGEDNNIWGCPRPKDAKELVENKPKIMAINFTSRCNLRCFMCRPENLNPMDHDIFPEMPIEMIEILARKYFSDLECLLTAGSGELFVHKNFTEIIDLIEKYRPKFVSTSTNGSFNLSDDVWRKVINTNDLLMFSIDSFTEELHKKIRQFDIKRIFDSIEKIRKIKEEVRPEFKYGFSYVIMKMNLHELDDFVLKATSEWGANQINLMHIHGHDDQSVLKEFEWKKKYNEKIHIIKEYSKNTKTYIEIPDFARDNDGGII